MKKKIQNLILSLYLVTTLNASNINSPLLNAVDKQNFEEVVKLIESGSDVNEKNQIGFTPLLIAAGWGDVEMLQYLISHGASLTAKSNRGFGVIHRAAMNKNSSVLKYLLENYNLDVNDREKGYCSPLDFSLRYNALQNHGSLDNARLLLSKGATKSINWKCRGYTPLMVAIPNKEVIDFLIENGANKTIKNRAGLTAYDMAKNQNAPTSVLSVLDTNSKNNMIHNKKVFQNTNLLWELKTAQNKHDSYTENEAIKYCSTLSIDGYNNWHIPSVNEYQSILSEKPYDGFIIDGVGTYHMNPEDFPNMSPFSYWVVLEDKSLGLLSTSWNKIYKKRDQDEKHFIRCVHSK